MFTRIIFGLLLLFLAIPAQAATLYIDPSTATLNRGDAITLNVRLDTDESTQECVNAIDGVISYDPSVILVDVSVGESIFPVWVEPPTINTETRTITFAGGIPNGYCGRVQGDPRLTNSIVQLVFRAPGLQVGGGEARNQADIKFLPETTAYLNDGLGTKASLQLLGTTLKLNDTVGSQIVDDWRAVVQSDNVPPEEFSIDLVRDEKTFGGKYYIVFNTTDKQTGLSGYEVIEEPLSRINFFDFGAANAPWITTRSPYLLKDQTLNSTIRVKAIDKAGNEYIATLIPDKSLRTTHWSFVALVAMGGLLLITLLGIALYLWRRHKQSAELEEMTLTE
jgi:hypothetical protein